MNINGNFAVALSGLVDSDIAPLFQGEEMLTWNDIDRHKMIVLLQTPFPVDAGGGLQDWSAIFARFSRPHGSPPMRTPLGRAHPSMFWLMRWAR